LSLVFKFMLLQQVAGRISRFCPILAAPLAIVALQGQAHAIINVNIFEDGPNLKVVTSGSLSQFGTPSGLPNRSCGASGALRGQFAAAGSLVCTGNDVSMNVYSVTGPPGWGGTGDLIGANSVQGPSFELIGSSFTLGYPGTMLLDPNYTLGSQIFSTAIFNNTTLASNGYTGNGLVGTWTIIGSNESVNVFVGTSAVPGPLPLLGAGAGLAWSRRLRRRIASSKTIPS
jgi:hypothetical protein